MSEQLSLFEQEERAAIIQFDMGVSKLDAENRAGVPYKWRGAIQYLRDLIENGDPLIDLFGQNPNICQIRTLTSYESADCAKRAWIDRAAAKKILVEAKFSNTRRLWTQIDGKEAFAEVWHKQEKP